MLNYIPSILQYPVKFHLFNLQFQQIISKEIEIPTQHIQKLLTAELSNQLQVLNTSTFWEDFCRISATAPNSSVAEEITKLKEWWDKLSPLANLTTSQLIGLLEEHVKPLHRGYEYLEAQFPSYPEILPQLNENRDRLNRLENHILNGLVARCDSALLFKLNLWDDDAIRALCCKIKEINPSVSLAIPEPSQAYLSDDHRLAIYDLLLQAKRKEEAEKVIAELTLRPIQPLRTQKEIAADLTNFNDFRNQILNDLNLEGWGNIAVSYLVNPKTINAKIMALIAHYASNLKHFLIKERIFASLVKLWHLRYIAFFALSFEVYHYLSFMVKPALFLIFSASTVSTLTSLLFVSIGLAPLWWLGWKYFDSLRTGVTDFFLSWKKTQILEALSVLEQAEHFISDQLSQTIIDLAHYDSVEIPHKLEKLKESLSKVSLTLNSFYWGEKTLCSGNLQSKINEVTEKIATIQDKLAEHASLLADFIAKNIEQQIQRLHKDKKSKEFRVTMPQAQLEHLTNFVKTYGSVQVYATFIKNIDIINLWKNAIYLNKFSASSHSRYPWGKRILMDDAINGWYKKLNGLLGDPEQRAAALELNKLLHGQRKLSEEQFSENVAALKLTPKEAEVTKKILQDHLYVSLNSNYPENACLLSKEHKQKIEKWYEDHADKIKTAITAIENFVGNPSSSLDVKELPNYFILLDGYDIYRFSQGKISRLEERKNMARKALENYKGDNPDIFKLLRLIPKEEYTRIAVPLALKRLNWIIEQLGTDSQIKVFSEKEIQLFDEQIEWSLLNISQFLRDSKSKLCDKPTESVISFLALCKRECFINEKVFSELSEAVKNPTPVKKPTIVTQYNLSQAYGAAESQKVLGDDVNNVVNKSVLAC